MQAEAHALIIYSEMKPGFCAGADLRELYQRSQAMEKAEAAERSAGFSGAHSPRVESDRCCAFDYDCGGAWSDVWRRVRAGAGLRFDYCRQDGAVLFSGAEAGVDSGVWRDSATEAGFGQCRGEGSVADGRSFNATKAQQIGLVSQVVGEGEALRAARATAAQLGKFDRATAAAAKKFIKPIPHEELRREIDIFCELFARPAVRGGIAEVCGEHGCAAVFAVVTYRVRW